MLLLAAAPPGVPDPDYVARPGDRAILCQFYEGRVLPATAAKSLDDWDYWQGVLDIEDDMVRKKLLDQLRRQGKIIDVAPWTPIQITEIHLYAEDDPRSPPYVVKPLEGPFRGVKLAVPTYAVCRLKPGPDAAPEPSRRKAPISREEAKERYRKSRSPETIQAELKAFYDLPDERRREIRERARKQYSFEELNIAENLRKSGKDEAARKAYEKILRDYSDLPEATKARERLKALPAPAEK